MKNMNIALIAMILAGCISQNVYAMRRDVSPKRGARMSQLQQEFLMALLPPSYLLEAGEDFSNPTYNAKQAAYWKSHGAAMFKKAQQLLREGVNINARFENGMTALILLQTIPSLAIDPTRFLLQHGADVNAKDTFGNTALDYIEGRAAWNQTQKEKLLQQHGAVHGAKSPEGIDESLNIGENLFDRISRK